MFILTFGQEDIDLTTNLEQASNILANAKIVEVNSSEYSYKNPLYVGDEVVFNFYSENAGPSDAENLVSTIKFPDGFSLVSYEFEGGSGEYDPITGIWRVGDLKLFDKTSTLSIKAIVTAKEDHQIRLESYSSTFDIDHSNNVNFINLLVDVRLPKANVIQEFNEGDTLADLVVEGENIKWYDTDVNATKNTANKNASVPLSLNTLLVHNTTYYASQTIDGKESSKRLAVKAVNKSLSTTEYDSLNHIINVYPNPFTVNVKINLPENVAIQQVEVINSIGQTVYETKTSQLELENVPSGLYVVRVSTNHGNITKKIIKK